MKISVLSDNKIDYLDFNAIFQAGRNLQAGNLKELLDTDAPRDDVYAAMSRISTALAEATDAMMAPAIAAGKEIGPDELSNIRDLVLEIFFGSNPGLREQIQAFLKNPDVLADGLYDEKRPAHAAFVFENVARDRNRNEIPPVKDHVRENLGTNRLNPIYAQALVAAARELGREESAEDVLALFDEGRPAGDALRAELERFDGEIDSGTLKALALDVLQRD